MKRKFLLLLLALTVMGCLTLAPHATVSTPEAQGPSMTVAVPPTGTDNVAPTSTPAPSQTSAATLPPFIASIPGIAATMTAGFSTPGMAATLSARQAMVAATEAVQMKSLAVSMLKMCTKPVETPVSSWDNIPIMPEATGSEEIRTLIGSFYCYQAPVAVPDMEAFYTGQMETQGWFLQFDQDGTMNFIKLGQQGPGGMLWIVSGPGDKKALKVVIIPFNFPG